ncbi:MAG: folate family ECF transporter S component [Oscillospiraceae bacterium]
MKNFKKSIMLLKDIKVLSVSAMLISLSIVLSFFSFSIGNIVKVSFSFAANSLIGFLFGPAVSMLSSGLIDLITAFVKPFGPYQFWFTFTAMVSGLIYGFVLYGKKPKLGNVVLACVLNTVIISFTLNTLGLSFLYGKSILALLPARITKGLILLPVEIFVTYFILKNTHNFKINKTLN